LGETDRCNQTVTRQELINSSDGGVMGCKEACLLFTILLFLLLLQHTSPCQDTKQIINSQAAYITSLSESRLVYGTAAPLPHNTISTMQ